MDRQKLHDRIYDESDIRGLVDEQYTYYPTDTDVVLDGVERNGDYSGEGGYLGESDWEFALAQESRGVIREITADDGEAE